MFENSRTHAKAKELKGHSTETESEAKARLETQGWVIPSEAHFDDTTKVYAMKKDTVEGEGEGEA
jgi:hypothetical protein